MYSWVSRGDHTSKIIAAMKSQFLRGVEEEEEEEAVNEDDESDVEGKVGLSAVLCPDTDDNDDGTKKGDGGSNVRMLSTSRPTRDKSAVSFSHSATVCRASKHASR